MMLIIILQTNLRQKNVIEQCSQGKITNENCDNAKAAIQKQKREDWIKAHGGK
ncbi:hypothetical protein [Escherichia sp. E2593]|uniref:hypothetical protein n=1 Tax=Escherichia sp. E2593 TaxID=2044458 RepID=UPI001FF06521|nr:hypothetical protein [Escherichia sp. E2593]